MAVQEKGLIDIAYEQLEDLRKFIEKDNTLLNFLKAPQVLEENKIALMRDVFGKRLERLFIEFLVVLIVKHRMAHLAKIIDDFIRLVEAEKGIARATVIVANPLDDDQRQNLITRLAAKTDLTVQLEVKVDAGILGGMIVILHDEIIDGSVHHELEMIKKQLAKVKVV